MVLYTKPIQGLEHTIGILFACHTLAGHTQVAVVWFGLPLTIKTEWTYFTLRNLFCYKNEMVFVSLYLFNRAKTTGPLLIENFQKAG